MEIILLRNRHNGGLPGEEYGRRLNRRCREVRAAAGVPSWDVEAARLKLNWAGRVLRGGAGPWTALALE